VTGGTDRPARRGHAEQARQRRHASEETTMRHALVPIQLINGARAAAGAQSAGRQGVDAPAEAPDAGKRQPRRFASLARRARARTLGLGAESHGGEA
jgi:hypothetical protein